MPKGKHHNKLDNKLLQAKQLLEKPLLCQSEKNLLSDLNAYFLKEIPALKAQKETTKLKLTEDQNKLNQLNASYRSFVLREFFTMSVPMFLIFCYYKSNSATDKKNGLEFLSFIDSQTSKLLLEIATIFIASIGFYYCFNRIVPVQVNLSQMGRNISQVEERLNQNKQLGQETENLLSSLEETYSNVKKKLDSIKPFKLSQTAMSLTLFSGNTKAQQKQTEEKTSEEVPSAKRQLF